MKTHRAIQCSRPRVSLKRGQKQIDRPQFPDLSHLGLRAVTVPRRKPSFLRRYK